MQITDLDRPGRTPRPAEGFPATVVNWITAVVLAIAVISVAYWLSGGTLDALPPPLVPEYLGTAAAFIVLGLAVRSIYLGSRTRWSRALTTLGLVAVAGWGAAVFIGPLQLHTDMDAVTVPGGSIPLIAPLAALAVALIATALLLTTSSDRIYARIPAEACILSALFIGLSAFLVYAYGDNISEPFLYMRRTRGPAGLSLTLLATAIAIADPRWLIHRAVRRMGWGAALFFCVLFALLALTGLTYRISQSDAQLQLSTRFESDTYTMRRLIEAKLNTDIKALKGGAALFAASDDVDRASWQAYVDGLNLSQDYPGVQGFGYALVVPASQVPEVENAVRAEGFPDFSIFPLEPPREIYTTIMYLLPFDARNREAFGFDMFSEATRRAAMIRARNSGQPAMTGQVTLLQENEGMVQKGFLIYEPVYRRGSPTDTVAQRKAAIQGYVYSPFRMNDFINATLGEQTFGINLEIFDQNPDDPDALQVSNQMYGRPMSPGSTGLPRTVQSLTNGGNTWLLRFTAQPEYVGLLDTKSRPRFVLFSGLLVSLALALATYFLASSRQRAVSIAGVLTQDLAKERDAAVLSQRKDEMLLDGIIEAMIVIDRDGIIERVNAAAEVMLRMGEEDMVGKHYQEVLLAYDDHDQPVPAHERPAEVALRSRQKIANAVINYRRRDGSSFPALLGVAPLVHNDELFGAIEIFRDISEERRLDRAKDEFVSVASHQLRTPITAQGWLLDILCDGETVGPLTDQQYELVQKLMKSNERLANLVSALLNVSRVESGRLTVTPTPTDLLELTESVLEDVAVELDHRQQHVTVDASPLPQLSVDPILIRQVILNLVTNASKYSADGSTIEIVIELRDDHVVYTVRDHGFGIPAAQRGQVFSKFFRGDNILHRQTDGNGLGLYLVKSIVELSGGRIWFDSTEDRGTTFTFTLPLAGSTAHDGEMRFGLAPGE